MTEPAPPFRLTHSPNLPELLLQLRCTIALTTYQAGKVVFISACDADKIVQLPRTFEGAMALATDGGDRLAVATRDEVVVLSNAASLAARYPQQPETYDGLFVPRATYYTGQVDIHALSFGRDGLMAAVTAFSCIATLDDSYSFVPRWRPSFVSGSAPEDRCHLNGMATDDGVVRLVTALADSDTPQGWRVRLPRGGVLVDVATGETVLRELPMPHSPRIHGGAVYLLFSATGELVRVDLSRGSVDVIRRFDAFVRGLACHGDYLFVGRSRMRTTSAFRDLEIAERAKTSGVTVLHIGTGVVVANLDYHASVEEIFDVAVLPGCVRPGILGTHEGIHSRALATPHATYWAGAPTPMSSITR